MKMAKFNVTPEQAAKAMNEDGLVAVVNGKYVEFGIKDSNDSDFSGAELTVIAESQDEALQIIVKRAKQSAACHAK